MEEHHKETTIDELMHYLQEHMLTKEDAKQFATKDEMQQGFSAINIRLDSVERELQEVNTRLTGLEKKVQDDGNMFAQEIMKLQKYHS